MQVQVDVMHQVCSLYACLPIRLLYSILRNTFTATATAAIIIEASHQNQCKWYVFQSLYETILAVFWLGREKGSSVCSARHQNSGNMFSLVSCGSPCGLLSPFSISPLLLLMMARSLSCWSRLAYLYRGRYSKNAATGELSCSLHYHTVYTLVLLAHLVSTWFQGHHHLLLLLAKYHLAKSVLVTLCHVNNGGK